MNDINYQNTIQNLVSDKFEGKKELAGKFALRYPISMEREMRRIARAYVKIIRDELKAALPELIKSYTKNVSLRADNSLYVRADGYNNLREELNKALEKIKNKIEMKEKSFNIRRLVENAAKGVEKLSISEWRRICNSTLGLDILEDYFSGEFFEQLLNGWTETNVNLIKTVKDDLLNDLEQTVLGSFYAGESSAVLKMKIQKEYNSSKNHAGMIARDQIAKLNSQLARQQMEDAGCSKYIWSASGDKRVRDCHREFDGQTFSFNDPPEGWYMTKSKGKVYTGRRCNPGEDICCRCVAIPVFDLESLVIPVNCNH